MEFGMFHQFPAIPGRTQREAFEEAFEQIDAAERWGHDRMWLAELHFDPRRSVLSAPLSIAAAVGARPVNHSRLAADVAHRCFLTPQLGGHLCFQHRFYHGFTAVVAAALACW